ncbi:MAG: uncharacterized protein K0Q48_599 [Bacillota bacterium]|nr:uncharacterized protein [Bacillota bacterium]
MFDWARIRSVAGVLALSLCLTFAFWGCGMKPENTSLQGGEESWKRTTLATGINAPLESNYIVSNPLTIEEVKEGDGKEYDYTYLKISGLQDLEVQKKINDKIKSVYDQLRVQDLPPYRGVKVRVPDGYTVASEQIYTNTLGNFNNILSVMLEKSAVWQPNGAQGNSDDKAFYDTARYVSEMETLNFDLNTGEEFKLADLFCDNVNPSELVNDYMSGYLSESGADSEGYYPRMFSGNIKLVEAFKGLSGDQKFGIYPYGLALVFDYRTPQFDTQCAAAATIVNFSELGDVLSVTKRFYKEGSTQKIYTSAGPTIKSLIGKGRVNEVSGDESFQVGNVSVTRSWRYSASLPEAMQKKLREMLETDPQELDRISAAYEAFAGPNGNDGKEGSCEIYLGSYQYGRYVNVTSSMNFYLMERFLQKMDYDCYDADTFKPLELKDVFRDGFDYKPLVLQAIKDAYGEGINANIAEEIYDKIQGFNLSSDEIYIPITQINEDGSTYDMNLNLPFSEIGCDNLVIFH